MTDSVPARKEVVEVGMDAARDELTDLMDLAAVRGARVIITRFGKPRAALIGMDDLERLQQLDAA